MSAATHEDQMPDGTQHPYAKAVGSGIWHIRPADDTWTNTDDRPNAYTLCGRAIRSVEVSTFDPSEEPINGDVCPACRLQAAAKDGAR